MVIPGIYKIIHFDQLPPECSDLAKWKNIYGELHPQRLKGIATSRYALSLCLKEKNISISPYDIKFSQGLWDLPFHASLSHSVNYSIAYICEKEKTQSIGVDIELKTRKITNEVREKISKCSLDPQLSVLEVWTSLEAGFKVINKNHTEIKHPLQLFTKKDSFYLNPKQPAAGQIRFVSHPELQIALAYT